MRLVTYILEAQYSHSRGEVVFEHPLVGRVGLLVSVLVLADACGGGEISDAPGGARLGPEASDPEVGNGVAPLVCPGASPDVRAQSGWQSYEAPLPADGALRFELKARPTAANLEGVVAVGAEDIDDFPKAAIAVRFDDSGLVDVRDGADYSSDLAYPWEPGVWYSIAISADIDAKTYDVEVGPCGEPRQKLIEDASFRDSANVSGELSTWAVWSYTADPLEVSTPAWMTSSGACTPATCLSLGHVCGTPQDGCGGTLSCGVCGDGETCSSGTCTNAPPPPPPVGTPYGHVVPSDVGNTIGVGVVGPVPTTVYTGPNPITVPGTTLENVVISEELDIEADNVTVRNCIIDTDGTNNYYGLNVDRGDNVLIEYNKINARAGAKIVRISSVCDAGLGNCPGAGNATNTTVRRNELSGGTDAFWINETNGMVVEDNYIHSMRVTSDEHVDGFQCGSGIVGFGSTITIRGNYIDIDHPTVEPPYTPGPTVANEVYFIHGWYTVLFESNFMHPWGSETIRVWPNVEAVTTIRYNVYSNEFHAFFAADPGRAAVNYQDGGATNATFACNRYEDGSFVEQSFVDGDYVPHITTGCPSY
jgi:hypothetical protein